MTEKKSDSVSDADKKKKDESTVPGEMSTNISKVNFSDIVKTVSYIKRAVELNQPRLIQRAIRQNTSIRRYVTSEQLNLTLKKYVPSNWPLRKEIEECISIIAEKEESTKQGKDNDEMDLEEDKEDMKTSLESLEEKEQESAATVFAPVTYMLPEIETYLYTLVCTTLLRYSMDEAAANIAGKIVQRIHTELTFNRRSLDLLSSKIFFYLSLAYQRIGKLDKIRSTLLLLYRTSCVRHDKMCQAVLLNLILSNYLHYNLVEQANIFVSRATFPENACNNQFCRYLYSMGRILATKLEYSESYQRLVNASRKAPQGCAKGFSRSVHKLMVIVQLLMGDIPERTLFNQPELRQSLKPYLKLAQSVHNGDLRQFNKAMEENAELFKLDNNYTLVQRLGHNVLKAGLRKISMSYSRISLADVAQKLHLQSADAAEYICAKAIHDGVIEAKIDHSNRCLSTFEVQDLYSTDEPQKAFHRRAAFCLDVHNEAVTSMRYPPAGLVTDNKDDKKKSEDPTNDDKTIDEIIKDMEDEMDD